MFKHKIETLFACVNITTKSVTLRKNDGLQSFQGK